jgi:hypothetical protein
MAYVHMLKSFLDYIFSSSFDYIQDSTYKKKSLNFTRLLHINQIQFCRKRDTKIMFLLCIFSNIDIIAIISLSYIYIEQWFLSL